MNMDALLESTRSVMNEVPACSPACAVVLGSGWGDALSTLPTVHEIGYTRIPCLGSTTVTGHDGRLAIVEIQGAQVLLFLGRRHWYEGQGWEPIAFPVYLCVTLGVPTMLLTNAAGGIRADLQPGDLMAIDDHINAMGGNPLIGEHDTTWGVRFPDLSNVYDPDLTEQLQVCGRERGLPVKRGVYLAASGPTYETPAEIRGYAALGAEAVGMSTVPEAVLAHAAGIRVAGLSCITNRAAGTSPAALSHDEVVRVTEEARPRMRQLLLDFLTASTRQH